MKTDIVATVWSVAQMVEAGVLRQKGGGESGWMVLMVPVVPQCRSCTSTTESTACRVMGSALAEFLAIEAPATQLSGQMYNQSGREQFLPCISIFVLCPGLCLNQTGFDSIHENLGHLLQCNRQLW